jgi:hypothetical protein
VADKGVLAAAGQHLHAADARGGRPHDLREIARGGVKARAAKVVLGAVLVPCGRRV